MLEEKVYSLAESVAERMGYELVRVKYFDRTRTLQVMIDFPGEGKRIGLEDCTKVSQELSVILDVEDVTPANYSLEVSSPGVDRPLVKMADFMKHRGQKIKLWLKSAVNGTKKCKATIKDTRGEAIVFELYDAQSIEVPIDNIEAANLLISETI
jgi:ribosome maturation factor RimP